MIKIGLTGSIGMGKSTTSHFFLDHSIPVYDSDAAVHKLYSGGAVSVIGNNFPSAIVGGKVDRQELGALVLGDKAALRKLESLIHPLVALDRLQFLGSCEKKAVPICVLDIPLLFETNATAAVDVIAVVSAGAAQQRARVLARPGMSAEKFASILEQQLPDALKRKMAHYVIDTGRGVHFARRQVNALLHALN